MEDTINLVVKLQMEVIQLKKELANLQRKYDRECSSHWATINEHEADRQYQIDMYKDQP
jgi:hypothetical protein